MVERIPKAEWERALRRFTERNAGRRTKLEHRDPEVGLQEQEHDHQLQGLVYDRRDDRIEIMLGGFEGAGPHLTHTLQSVTSLDLVTDETGRDILLTFGHDESQTLLRIEPPARG